MKPCRPASSVVAVTQSSVLSPQSCLWLALLCSLILLLSPQPARALPTELHTIISFEAAKLPGVPDEFRDQDVLGNPDVPDPRDEDATIIEGSLDEDNDRMPDGLLQLIRIFDRNAVWGWGSHFWDPAAGPWAGHLLLLNPLPPQNAWQRASMLYAQALSLYPTDSARAYYLLGRVSHLLEDMATPAHTHLDPHVSDALAGFLRIPELAADSFEEYLSRTYVSNVASVGPGNAAGRIHFEEDFVTANLDPVPLIYLGSAGHPELGDLFRLFNSMAREAARWDSNDANGTGPDGIGHGSIRHNHRISDADCQRMASDLMPKAVAHVATLYRIFWRDTHPQASLPDIGPFPGDIDRDGTVGTFDLLRLIAAFDSSAGAAAFDPTCDLDTSGTVDVADLQIFISNFGRTE